MKAAKQRPNQNQPLTREVLLSQLRGKTQTADFQLDRANVDQANRTVDLAFASETPYDRWFGREILDMSPKAMRLDRLKSGAALLVNHNADQQVGVVEQARIGPDRVARATPRFGRGALATEIFNDVQDGIRSKVSVGYLVHDMVLESKKGDLSTYRVTDWEPLEISIVSVPADNSVGVGRSRYSSEQESSMNEQQATSAAGQVSAFLNDADSVRKEGAEERTLQVREMLALGNEFEPIAKGAKALSERGASDPTMTPEKLRQAILDLVRQTHKPTQTAQISSADRAFAGENRIPYGESPREVMYGQVQVFKGIGEQFGKSDREVAYRAGMWARAAIFGDTNAARWCQDAGVQLQHYSADPTMQRAMTEGVFSSAGWLVPTEMESAIIANREVYGVARRISRVFPMNSAILQIPRVTSDITAYFVGEDTAGTDSDSAGDQVALTLKDLMAKTRIGKSTAQDTAVPLSEFIAGEQARAFAVKEDSCFINGDGTSTYGGMQGIKTLLETAAYSGGTVKAATNHDTLPEVDASDASSLLGLLPVYARAGARWLVSGVAEALVFGRLKVTAGGNDRTTLQGQILEQDFAGFPITVAHHMPNGASTDYSNKLMVVLGNFQLGSAMGSGAGMNMTVDPYTEADKNMIRIITTERIDIVHHGVNKSTTTPGPIVGLLGE